MLILKTVTASHCKGPRGPRNWQSRVLIALINFLMCFVIAHFFFFIIGSTMLPRIRHSRPISKERGGLWSGARVTARDVCGTRGLLPTACDTSSSAKDCKVIQGQESGLRRGGQVRLGRGPEAEPDLHILLSALFLLTRPCPTPTMSHTSPAPPHPWRESYWKGSYSICWCF